MYLDGLAVLCCFTSLFVYHWFASLVHAIVTDLFGFGCVYGLDCGHGYQDQYASPCYKIKYSHLIFLYSAGIAAAAGPTGLAPNAGAGTGVELTKAGVVTAPKLGAGADDTDAGGV